MGIEGRLVIASLVVILLIGASSIQYAYSESFLIWTERTIYDHNSLVVVNGEVSDPIPNVDAVIIVVNPTGEIAAIDQIEVISNVTFQTTFITSGPLWSYDGIYTVMGRYGSLNDAVTIELTGGISAPITVSTDRDSYKKGDTIKIFGEVRERLTGFPVSMQIIAANGDLVTIQALDVGYYNKFSTAVTAGGLLWDSTGTYTIKVQYGTAARTAETTFQFEGSSSTPIPPSPVSTTTVIVPSGTSVPGCEINLSCYIPYSISVKTGQTVMWTNKDIAAHTVTSGSGGMRESVAAIFDSSLVMVGNSFSYTFTKAGEYPYFCMLHPWMTGIVTVEGTTPTMSGVNLGLDIDPMLPFDITANDMITLSFTAQSEVLKGESGTFSHLDYRVIISKNGDEVWRNQFHDHDGNLELQITPSEGSFSVTGGKEIGSTFTGAFMVSGPIFMDNGNYEISGQIVGIEFNPLSTPLVDNFNVQVIGGGTMLDTIPPKILQPKDIVVDASDSIGAFVTYEVLAIDNEDEIIKPSCSPSSGSLFSIGDTEVVCSAFDSSGNAAPQKSFIVKVNAPSLLIPNWIKEVAAFWCDDKIDDASFIEGIQYLIDNDIIIVQATSLGYGGSQEIPSWIKNNACWWSQGLISDNDFASGLQYLIGQGIIRV